MGKKPLPRRVLINNWISQIGDKCFTTDGVTIFCQACQKYVSSEKRFHLLQHTRTALHQSKIQEENKRNDDSNNKSKSSSTASSSAKPIPSTSLIKVEQGSSIAGAKTSLFTSTSKRYTSKSKCFVCNVKLLQHEAEAGSKSFELRPHLESSESSLIIQGLSLPLPPPSNSGKLNSKSIIQLLSPFFMDDLNINVYSSSSKPPTPNDNANDEDNNNLGFVINDLSILANLKLGLRHVDYCARCTFKLKQSIKLFAQLKELQKEVYSLRRNIIGNIKRLYDQVLEERRTMKEKKKNKKRIYKRLYSKKQLTEQRLRSVIIKGISSTPQFNFSCSKTTSNSNNDDDDHDNELNSSYVNRTPLKFEPENTDICPPVNENGQEVANVLPSPVPTQVDNDLTVDIKPDLASLNVPVTLIDIKHDAGSSNTKSDLMGSNETNPPPKCPKSKELRTTTVRMKTKTTPVELGSSSSSSSLTTATKKSKTKKLPHDIGKVAPRLPPFICSECQKEFKQYRHLRQHMALHFHPHKCTLCPATFPWRHALIAHETTKHTELGRPPLPQCPQCGRSFNSKSILKIHINSVHLDVGSFGCGQCGYIATLEHNLKRHIKLVHNKIKDFKCSICDKLFARKDELKTHGYLHSGERPFGCKFDGCNKCFRSRNKCRIHELTHRGADGGRAEPKHVCHICGKGFMVSNYLYYHLKYSHANQEDGTSVVKKRVRKPAVPKPKTKTKTKKTLDNNTQIQIPNFQYQNLSQKQHQPIMIQEGILVNLPPPPPYESLSLTTLLNPGFLEQFQLFHQ